MHRGNLLSVHLGHFQGKNGMLQLMQENSLTSSIMHPFTKAPSIIKDRITNLKNKGNVKSKLKLCRHCWIDIRECRAFRVRTVKS